MIAGQSKQKDVMQSNWEHIVDYTTTQTTASWEYH